MCVGGEGGGLKEENSWNQLIVFTTLRLLVSCIYIKHSNNIEEYICYAILLWPLYVVDIKSCHPEGGLILKSCHPEGGLFLKSCHPEGLFFLKSCHPKGGLFLNSCHPEGGLILKSCHPMEVWFSKVVTPREVWFSKVVTPREVCFSYCFSLKENNICWGFINWYDANNCFILPQATLGEIA